MMTRLPSITCFFSWWERTPCMGLQLNSEATLAKASVTDEFFLPTCTKRTAASAAFHAAMMTSARLSSTVSLPTMMVFAAAAMKPSMWQAMSTLATSPAFSCLDSPFRGEKWPTSSFTEMHVGKATPFSIFRPFSFLLNSLPVSSSMILSPISHSVAMSASSTHASITFCRALFTMSPAARYFVVTSGLLRSLISSFSDSSDIANVCA
mmetsp:Transcript_59903/g.175074  ORF Transcript_59903/g.175074 Transcript_59903/m.175074 type:complete len:208 (+) Transcript_59903:678-1301(+)